MELRLEGEQTETVMVYMSYEEFLKYRPYDKQLGTLRLVRVGNTINLVLKKGNQDYPILKISNDGIERSCMSDLCGLPLNRYREVRLIGSVHD